MRGRDYLKDAARDDSKEFPRFQWVVPASTLDTPEGPGCENEATCGSRVYVLIELRAATQRLNGVVRPRIA
jgi:hypothetical protein